MNDYDYRTLALAVASFEDTDETAGGTPVGYNENTVMEH